MKGIAFYLLSTYVVQILFIGIKCQTIIMCFSNTFIYHCFFCSLLFFFNMITVVIILSFFLFYWEEIKTLGVKLDPGYEWHFSLKNCPISMRHRTIKIHKLQSNPSVVNTRQQSKQVHDSCDHCLSTRVQYKNFQIDSAMTLWNDKWFFGISLWIKQTISFGLGNSMKYISYLLLIIKLQSKKATTISMTLKFY